MSEPTIFDTPPQEVVDVTPPAPVIPTEVADLVGEGKKYRSVEDALKSVPHAQKHIQTLEEENARIKAELEKRRTAEELLDEVKSGIQSGVTPSRVEFNQDDVVKTVAQILEQKEAEKQAVANVDTVIGAFTAQFGEKAQEVFRTVATEAGMSLQALNQLSATSPSAVLKLAGLNGKREASPAKTGSSVNTQALAQTQPPGELSARVTGRSTKDLVNAWKIAGEKVKRQSNG